MNLKEKKSATLNHLKTSAFLYHNIYMRIV